MSDLIEVSLYTIEHTINGTRRYGLDVVLLACVPRIGDCVELKKNSGFYYSIKEIIFVNGGEVIAIVE